MGELRDGELGTHVDDEVTTALTSVEEETMTDREALEERVKVLTTEVERHKLTSLEREAIAAAIDAEHLRGAWRWADSLRELLERTR